ncbi:MAG: DUF1015 family protein [Oscillospiraceae bacterium]|nr:DUF1015 family protein [Oscillospiraceae bacterium]
MPIIRPFAAVRPKKEYASKVAELPYDVMTSDEARETAKNNPYSFLHVDKAEIDLPEGSHIYSGEVYEKACENLCRLCGTGVFKQDAEPYFYIYRQIMGGRSQTGLAACVSVDDYIDGKIKKHEFTRADKEKDRIRHVDACDANTGPIFLCYRGKSAINAILNKYVNTEPEYDFTRADGVAHTVWFVNGKSDISLLREEFSNAGAFYIADGHHRAASAAKVALKRRAENPGYDGTEEFNFFLAVLFSKDDLAIMDYNRVIRDYNGLKEDEFYAKAALNFDIAETEDEKPFKPQKKHEFGMFAFDKWHKLTAKNGTFDASDPVKSLDVSILQENLIAPVFGITDPRRDNRIDFVGGIRGLEELERRCKTDMKAAFSLYPVSLDELMAIADAGEVMPPKSTWFEPKLLSGLFIHKLS